MDKKDELTQIVKTVQEDIGQFELLYSQIINKIYFWCYTIVKDDTTAKDLTQEAMIQIYKKIATVQQPEYFSSWMYKLVRNVCYNHLKVYKRSDKLVLDSDDYTVKYEQTVIEERRDSLPEEAYNLQEIKRLIKQFIDNLPMKQREVITLFYLEEMKINEISEILNYNAGSVKSRLHAGRKNLELQIKEYQERNNVKLYSASILPLLGVILKDYQDDICNKQNLQYDKSLYTVSNNSLLFNFLQMLSGKLAIIIASIVVVGVITAVVIIGKSNQDKNNVGDKTTLSAFNDQGMYQKSKGHPYIEDITYLEFPMREGIDVTIKLKVDIEETDMKILFNNEELSFEKNQKDIYLKVRENGVYTIVTDEYKTNFEIDNIAIYAPELVEAYNEDEYLLLVINDEQSQIDFQKSFIEWRGKVYQIPKDYKIKGKFDGVVKVTLFNYNEDFIEYNLDFK
jgi:RNA polymerase sigma-70 factor (ECF subfamily)